MRKVSVFNSLPGRKCRGVEPSVPPHGCRTAPQKRHARCLKVKLAARRLHKASSRVRQPAATFWNYTLILLRLENNLDVKCTSYYDFYTSGL